MVTGGLTLYQGRRHNFQSGGGGGGGGGAL